VVLFILSSEISAYSEGEGLILIAWSMEEKWRAAYKADGDVQRKIKGLNDLFNPLKS